MSNLPPKVIVLGHSYPSPFKKCHEWFTFQNVIFSGKRMILLRYMDDIMGHIHFYIVDDIIFNCMILLCYRNISVIISKGLDYFYDI